MRIDRLEDPEPVGAEKPAMPLGLRVVLGLMITGAGVYAVDIWKALAGEIHPERGSAAASGLVVTIGLVFGLIRRRRIALWIARFYALLALVIGIALVVLLITSDAVATHRTAFRQSLATTMAGGFVLWLLLSDQVREYFSSRARWRRSNREEDASSPTDAAGER